MWTHFRHLRSKSFSRYKQLFNPMGFDPTIALWKFEESIETPTPKVGVHLGVWRFILSHSSTLSGTWNLIPRLHFWPAPSQALTLVTSPRLRLWQSILQICFKFLIPLQLFWLPPMVGDIGPQAKMLHVYSYVWNMGTFDLPITKNANCVD
jgi:hypothetical protein